MNENGRRVAVHAAQVAPTGARFSAAASAAVTLAVAGMAAILACEGPDRASLESDQAASGNAHPVLIRGDAVCESCRIGTRLLVTLGDRDGPASLPGMLSSVALDSNGNYYVATWPGDQLYSFEPTGALRTVIGTQGEGPLEFGSLIQVLVGPGDSLYLVDRTLRRIEVATADGEYVRTVEGIRAMTAPHSLVRLPDGDFVVNADYLDISRVGYPLHRHAPDGRYLFAFGAVDPTYGPSISTLRTLAVGSGGLILAMDPTSYRMEAYDSMGNLRRSWRREVSWFTATTPDLVQPTTPENPPTPWVAAWRLREDSLALVLVAVPDPQWARGLEFQPGANENEGYYSTVDHDALHDTLIELLDLERGIPIAAARVDPFLLHILDDSTAAGPKLDEFEVTHVNVWRIQVDREQSTRR